MSQRAFTARIIIRNDEERAALWRTHRIFNERLRKILPFVHRMKRGDDDPRYAEIYRSISSSQSAHARLEAVTSLDWSPKKEKTGWRKLAAELIAEGKLLFDRERELPGLSTEFRRKLFEGACQMIAAHRELVALWEKEHDEWVQKRAKWEEDNPEYMKIRPELVAFENQYGQTGKRRLRWHKWIELFQSRPDFAAWRGEPAVVHELDTDAKRRIAKARPGKRNRIAAEEFFKKNPELKELDSKHDYYQREFARPWAKKRHPDGFKHRPTFTEPSAEKHSFWFQFKKKDTYKLLDIQKGSLMLQLLKTDDSSPSSQWRNIEFRPDPRLRRLRKSSSIEDKHYTMTYSDPALGIDRQAEIRGAKLIFRPARPDGNAYLYFTVDVPDLPCRIKTTQDWCDKHGTEKLRKKIHKELGGDPITCAVDLGIRHLATATVRRDGKIVRARFIRLEDRPGRGPRLHAVKRHKCALSAKRGRRGKPVRNENFCLKLQKHCNAMGEDRFKKGARRIVNFARENECDLIILEKLAGFIPDAERDRGINRALMEWNRGNLVKWIKQLAVDAGMRIVEVHPSGTSQICSKCGALGTRFSSDHGRPNFEYVGKLFACPECGYAANADHNASVNLHRRYFGELPFVKTIRKGVTRVTRPDGESVEVEIESIQKRLAARVFRMCRGESASF